MIRDNRRQHFAMLLSAIDDKQSINLLLNLATWLSPRSSHRMSKDSPTSASPRPCGQGGESLDIRVASRAKKTDILDDLVCLDRSCTYDHTPDRVHMHSTHKESSEAPALTLAALSGTDKGDN